MSGEFDEAYKQLVDPDANIKTPEFDWGQDMQAELLSALLNDRKFLAETAHLLNYKYFTLKSHQAVARVLLAHFAKYKALPTKAVLMNDVAQGVKPEVALMNRGMVQTLLDIHQPGLEDRQHYVDRLLAFAKVSAVKVASSKMLDELGKGPDPDWDKIAAIFKEALSVDVRPDTGLDYFGALADRYTDQAEDTDVFTTGLVSLDGTLTRGGMARGEIFSIMSPPGVGKSLFLCRLAAENVRRGRKVLFVSCEMSEKDIAFRIDSMLSKVPHKSLRAESATVAERVGKVQEGLTDKRPFIIKQFPAGQCDVDTIRALLERCEAEGFRADILVVDYVGEMKVSKARKRYEALEELVSELRGLGVEKGACVVTAMQPNREAVETMETGVILSSMLGDSFGQLRPLDGFWTLNQSQAEKQQGTGRLWVDKTRAGISKEMIYVTYDPETLEITESTQASYRTKMNDIKVFADDNEIAMKTFGKRKPKGGWEDFVGAGE